MISCTEFIYSYSELFKFIEEKDGKEGVTRYWEFVSDHYVKDRLGKCVEEAGIQGCYNYWAKSLSEEAADFTMTLDGDTFVIDMHHCPDGFWTAKRCSRITITAVIATCCIAVCWSRWASVTITTCPVRIMRNAV